MVSWRAVPEEEARSRWDAELSFFPEQTVFQSLDWADYKRALGWTAHRFAALRPDGSFAAMAQMLARTYPLSSAVVWCRGGPVGDPALWNGELLALFARELLARRIFCRLSSDRTFSAHEAAALKKNGWHKPTSPLSSDRSLSLDLTGNEEALKSRLSPNWRHNLNRGLKKNLIRPWDEPRAEELQAVYQSMQDYKKIGLQHSNAELTALFGGMKDRLLLFRCDDATGRPIAFRACALFGRRAWDLLAAASPEARKTYASYALLWTILLECQKRSVTSYDLGGADPHGVKGVYDFKLGVGGQDVHFLGEWDWATSALVRHGANWMIRGRRP